MNRLICLLTLTLLFSSLRTFGQKSLPYRADGTFVVLQFNDIHLDGNHKAGTDSSFKTMKTVVESVRPDLVVLNGDIVTEKAGADKVFGEIVRRMSTQKVPFVLTMGNHDPEVMSKSAIYDILETSPYYVGSRGPEDLAPSMGNCFITLTDKDGKTEGVLYFLDSNDYHPNKFVQHYDWIHFDQIAWYRDVSEGITRANGGQALPALMFFHIPIPEFEWIDGDDRTFGHKAEEHGEILGINSGLFASLIGMGDVMGVFTGHNHDNDEIGINRGIALGYGRVTGHDAYGDLERGGRVIKLYEGARKFDSWIVTPKGSEGIYYFPSGLNSIEEKEATYLPALKSETGGRGVAYNYYEGNFKMTSDITEHARVHSGTLPYFSIKEFARRDHFAYKYRTLIDIPERGIYRFYTYSDDGSVLSIDGQTVVGNDGGHSALRAEGKVALEKGLHLLEVSYFEDYMGEELEIGFSSKTLTERPLPREILFLPAGKE